MQRTSFLNVTCSVGTPTGRTSMTVGGDLSRGERNNICEADFPGVKFRTYETYELSGEVMEYSGRVQSVYFARAGTEVIGAVASGTQVIHVGFPADFDVNGGSLLHEQSGNVYSYSTVDMQGDTITLTAPLGSGLTFSDGDMLYVYPLSNEARAIVALSDSADEAPVDVRVSHTLRALLAEGVRAPGTGESVIVEQVESEL